MTEMLTPLGASSNAVEQPPTVEASPRAPVLITEQQVLFATAAAVPLRPARTTPHWIQAIRAMLFTASVSSSNDARPKRRHYPPRNDFLEDSRMAREMFRL